MHGRRFLCFASLLAILGARANAQWTVTNLHPAGAAYSEAYGASGTNQVGYANVGFVPRASLWSGAAASRVDLAPSGATSSIARGASGANQVGYAFIGGARRASLWSGVAASWLDLTPAGSTFSDAYGASGGSQVGQAFVTGVDRASLWSGSAGSWVDLHPAGSIGSVAYSAYGTNQVGYASIGSLGGAARASVWSGTAASWVDLHALLPAGFSSSEARSISSDGSYLYIAGFGHKTLTSTPEALLWTQPVPEPSTMAVLGLGVVALLRRRPEKGSWPEKGS